MAVTGTFLADFDDFYSAVIESQKHLQALKERADTVGTTFDAVSQSLDPGTVAFDAATMATAIDTAAQASLAASEALAGVSGAIEATAEKMTTAGDSGGGAIQQLSERAQELPPAIGLGSVAAEVFDGKMASLTSSLTRGGVAGALEMVASKVIEFGADMVNTAGEVSDLSAKFGISTDGIQQFQFISEATGATMQSLAGAARTIAVNVAEGDSSALGAFQRLGISADELKGKSPDEMFFTVSRALAAVKDTGEQASLAMDVGGKKMVESLGAVNNGMDTLREQAPVMNREIVSSIDSLADSSATWAAQQKTDIQNTLGLWAVLIDKGPMATLAAYEDMNEGTAPTMADMANRIKDATVYEEAHANAIRTKTMAQAEYNRIEKELTASALASIEVNKEIAKHEGEVQRIRNAMFSTDAIDKAQLYLEALNGAENISKLTAEQQKALNDAVQKGIAAYTALGETVPREMLKVANATRTGVDPLLDTLSGLIPVTRSFSTETSKAWDTFKAKVDDASASINATIAASAEYQANRWRELGGTTRADLQATADKHQATYDYVLLHSDKFTAAQIENFRTIAVNAQEAANQWGATFIDNLDAVAVAADHTTAAVDAVAAAATNSKAAIDAAFSLPTVNPVTGEGMQGTDPRVKGYLMSGYTLSEAISLAQGTGFGIMGPSGTWTGSGYKYGIQGDPFAKSYFDQGTVQPWAAAAGGSTTVNVNVGGSVIAERDLVDSIQRGMVDSARAGGTRLPARA